MGSTGKRRRRSHSRGRRIVLWLGLALLAIATGFLGGVLYRDLPPRPPAPVAPAPRASRAILESLLGPLASGLTRVRVADRAAAQALSRQLEEAARDDPSLSVTPITHGDGSVRFSVVLDATAHPVDLWWPAPAPRLAVVIDDMGRNLARAEAFLDLEIPVTPSIIPYLRQSREVAEAARGRGRAYLLHLPMQPRNYPTTDPGRGALLEGMAETEVRRTVVADLDAVPGVSGVNNHMGSRFTELEGPLRWVMDELAKRGLFFLDSVTSSATVAATVAWEAGLATTRRDVFIDNDREVDVIGRQIDRALEKARQNGSAVLIGHPYPETLDALRKATVRIRAAGVRVVSITELVKRKGSP
jgi:polysaccharide deacetylase 2 family uncharacterized protein YibQ